MVFIDIWNYIRGKDFWSFGNKLKSDDSKLEWFYWFALKVVVYLAGIYHFLFKV
ncbi:Uncharacterised protein [Moraxella ovis]|uniref:Uncharacterized protein n=1 Tax=Moraxella ovis TaxID=29433 RepID=A0A378PJW8_9GAMM|nr:Uncharacterised protein [Moraxella ovis]